MPTCVDAPGGKPPSTTLIGQIFDRLTVLSFAGRTKHGKPIWLCRCECGTETTVLAVSLRSKRTRSCGCINREVTIANQTLSTDEFVARAKRTWGDRYDYSSTVYHGSYNEVTVVCKVHGPFSVRANNHLNNNCGCTQCSSDNSRRKSVRRLIALSKQVHGDAYGYDRVPPLSSRDNVVPITCPSHGEFLATLRHHATGTGCPKCRVESNVLINDLTGRRFGELTVVECIGRTHHGKPRWRCLCDCGSTTTSCSNTLQTGLKLSCGCRRSRLKTNDLSGQEFGRLTVIKQARTTYRTRWHCVCECGNKHIVASVHLKSGHTQACPKCRLSTGENAVAAMLKKFDIEYVPQYPIPGGLRKHRRSTLYVDFFIKRLSLCIEYDGEHHFSDVFGDGQFESQKVRDAEKDLWCESNGHAMLRIPYWDKARIEEIILEAIESCQRMSTTT